MKLPLTKHSRLCSRINEHPSRSAIHLHCNNVIFTGPFPIEVYWEGKRLLSTVVVHLINLSALGCKLRLPVTPLDRQLLLPLALPSLLPIHFPSASFLQHGAQCPLLPHLAHVFPLAGHTLSRAKCPDLPHA